MTGPVLAFDIKATKGAKLTRIEPARMSEDEVAQAAVSAAGTEDRATLAAVFAGLMGVDLQRADLLEAVRARNGLSLERVTEALNSHGLKAQLGTGQAQTPALAETDAGGLVLVLASENAMLTVFDADAKGRQREVPEADLNLSGRTITAHVAPDELTRRHGKTGKAEHWFWSHLVRQKRLLGEVALGSFVANILAVAVALFSLQVYDRVIPHQSVSTLWVLAIGAGVAMLMEACLRIARARLMDSAGRRIELKVQSLLMGRLLGMKADPNRSPSQTFAAMRDFSQVREFFTSSTIGSLTDLPFIILFLALVASIGGNIVWILFAGGILMVVPSLFVQKRMMALTHATQGASTKQSRLLQEAIYGVDTIKSQRGEGRFRRDWSELVALSSLASTDQRKLSSTLTSWAQGVQQATYVSTVVAGAYMVFAGEFTIGTIIAIGILTSRTLGPLNGLAGILSRWTNVKAALEALDAVVDAEQDVEEDRGYLRRDTLKGGFELREMSYAYDPESSASIDIPALSIKPGQRIAVLGANGSGKSTLLKILSGLHRPTSGRVLIDGVDMGQVMARDLRRSIGFLSQEVRLFAGTLRDNLNLTLLENDDDRLLAALDFAGLGPFVANHPKGLDLVIHDGGEGLSIGQRQSIGWARLWLQDPSVCLLDEPTAALDSTLETTLVDRLRVWLDGRTAIIATHRVPIMELTDRVMILQNGRLAVDGPRDEVLAHMTQRKAVS